MTDHAATIARLKLGLAYVEHDGAPEFCARCQRQMDNAEGHCGSDLCPRCWGERVNEDRDSYPINHTEE